MSLRNRATGFALGTTPGGNHLGSRQAKTSTPQRTVKLPQCVLLHSFLAYILTCQPKLRAAMDATRIRDGRPVILKKVFPNERPHELKINRLFSSPEHSSDRDNHCAPLLGV